MVHQAHFDLAEKMFIGKHLLACMQILMSVNQISKPLVTHSFSYWVTPLNCSISKESTY